MGWSWPESRAISSGWLTDMGVAARRRAEEFTWARFRAGIGDVVGGILGSSQTELAHSYV